MKLVRFVRVGFWLLPWLFRRHGWGQKNFIAVSFIASKSQIHANHFDSYSNLFYSLFSQWCIPGTPNQPKNVDLVARGSIEYPIMPFKPMHYSQNFLSPNMGPCQCSCIMSYESFIQARIQARLLCNPSLPEPIHRSNTGRISIAVLYFMYWAKFYISFVEKFGVTPMRLRVQW